MPNRGTNAKSSERTSIISFSRKPTVWSRPAANRLTKSGGFLHPSCSSALESGAGVAPVADLFESLCTGLLEQAYAMASMLEFVDVGPNFRLPGFVVDSRFPT